MAYECGGPTYQNIAGFWDPNKEYIYDKRALLFLSSHISVLQQEARDDDD
ncbi:hypothetical protein M422DRAFT_248193 [Sphaerobolus stellatus SS14]|uniref:Uncharacterized protein n=1 Tax=Sphaerobolus stellatus (strain SS14) TaxID=990650 RepID=A0A0C9VJ78_SPHS4|nr:hypothetical protein M422DRAFT_248193 [Sphaerobolus stellatus SS14]